MVQESSSVARSGALIVGSPSPYRAEICEMLEGLGYDVELADEGPDGLDALSQGGHQVCLLDVEEAGMAGEDFVKLAKRFSPWLQLIPVVGEGCRMSQIVTLLRMGVCDIFRKSDDAAEVAVSVGAAIARFERWKSMLSRKSKCSDAELVKSKS